MNRHRKVCPKGHVFFKTSDCPACPQCESARKPEAGFLAALAAPARRALESEGLNTLAKLARKSEAQVLDLHGMGPGSMPLLRKALKEAGRGFNKT